MISAAIRIVVAIAALAAFAARPHVTPALQLSLWTGLHAPASRFGAETWLAAGYFRPPAGWFGDYALAHLGSAIGLRGLGVLAALGFTLALGITEHRARARGGAVFAALAVLLAFACATSAFRVGDRLATDTFFAALTLAALDRAGRARYLTAAVAFAWAWFSPDALLAAIFAAATAAGLTFEALATEDDGRHAPRDAWLVATACLVAIALTPATIGYMGASLAALHLDGAKTATSIYAGDVAPLAYHGGFTALLFLALVLGGTYGPAAIARARAAAVPAGDPPFPAGGSGPADAALLAVAIVLGFANGYLLPIAGVVAAPVLAGAAARRFGRPALPRVVPAGMVAVGTLALLALTIADQRRGPTRFDATPLVADIAREPGVHALYCSTPAWCNGALGSRVRVGLDGRSGWPEGAVTDQATVATIGPHWYQILASAGVDRVVANRTTALAGVLRLRPDWHEIGEDTRAAAFAKGPR